MAHSIRKDNNTSLNAAWIAPTYAQRKLQTLQADLGNSTSWLNMYKMTAKACEAIQPLPHNFNRIRWQQSGKDVAAHTKHLKQLNKTHLNTQVATQCVVVAPTTVIACDEISTAVSEEINRSSGFDLSNG